MAQDYLSLVDADFNQFFKFMVQYANAKCTGSTPEWTHIPQAALTSIADMYAAWYTAYSAVLKPHTPVETEAKNDAKTAGKKAVRLFVNQYLRFPPVTDEDRTAMNIPNHDGHPTPVPVPSDIPEVEAQTPRPRTLQFRFRRFTMKRWGKPGDVHGMELVWLASGAPPHEVEELVHSSFATKSPLELSFKESERGTRVYYAVRWETGTAKKGAFSEIFSAIIP
ncbi:MAG: hypothetical protein LBK08_12880 [Treponema sp.]|jgi:hypothetical protein|nr:hypothetical protein [Treponema sp.]